MCSRCLLGGHAGFHCVVDEEFCPPANDPLRVRFEALLAQAKSLSGAARRQVWEQMYAERRPDPTSPDSFVNQAAESKERARKDAGRRRPFRE